MLLSCVLSFSFKNCSQNDPSKSLNRISHPSTEKPVMTLNFIQSKHQNLHSDPHVCKTPKYMIRQLKRMVYVFLNT